MSLETSNEPTGPRGDSQRLDPRSRRSWLARLGAADFLFFLIKGLLWLAVPTLIVAWQTLAR